MTIALIRSIYQECLVPREQDIAELDISDVNWILILEKEVHHTNAHPIHENILETHLEQAIFRRLAQSNLHIHSAAGKGILVTVSPIHFQCLENNPNTQPREKATQTSEPAPSSARSMTTYHLPNPPSLPVSTP
jgi:hypothetical protein